MTMDGEAPGKAPPTRSGSGSPPPPQVSRVGAVGVIVMMIVIGILVVFVVAGGLSSYLSGRRPTDRS